MDFRNAIINHTAFIEKAILDAIKKLAEVDSVSVNGKIYVPLESIREILKGE